MTYRDVTLAPDDIEWFGVDDRNRLKDAVFNDTKFQAIATELGPIETLHQYTRLHRAIANQLIVYAVDDPTTSDWARRTIALCFRTKKRRNQARWMVRDLLGTDGAEKTIRELDRRYPRAVWGSETETEQ